MRYEDARVFMMEQVLQEQKLFRRWRRVMATIYDLDLMRQALEKVEVDGEYGTCLWCGGDSEPEEYERDERGLAVFPHKIIKPMVVHHKPDCLRQRALGLDKKEE